MHILIAALILSVVQPQASAASISGQIPGHGAMVSASVFCAPESPDAESFVQHLGARIGSLHEDPQALPDGTVSVHAGLTGEFACDALKPGAYIVFAHVSGLDPAGIYNALLVGRTSVTDGQRKYLAIFTDTYGGVEPRSPEGGPVPQG